MSSRVNITYNFSDTVSGGNLNAVGSLDLATAADIQHQTIVTVATTAAAVSLGSVANPGMVLLRNQDDTNYIQLALDSGITQIFATLDPCAIPGDVRTGGFALLKPGATIYAKAHTATCKMWVQAVTNPT